MGGAKKTSPAQAQKRQADESAKKDGTKSKKERKMQSQMKSLQNQRFELLLPMNRPQKFLKTLKQSLRKNYRDRQVLKSLLQILT